MKSPIKDTPKEDKPHNKGQAKSTRVYTLYRKSLLTEDNLSTKDRTAGVEGDLTLRTPVHAVKIASKAVIIISSQMHESTS